ncbi:ACP phosphodiesterase [Clostridium sp. SHJSY1]|uniref:acyl carrier protein phosphodiesterase n=1 Tax=Clostridium sp. SHJSY1 TaxID=2942483 RepID=UPI0028758888|nr:ACP phosphodiesterase [Clostridium sp. SHJSY1]MDS0525524.1 ACP phosphodiesterase [Clostridium sp. SHJSY1]
MNYLAHIYLAEDNKENMLGNFLGDFVNKSLENKFDDSIKRGIFMHRKLDTFTDSHEDFIRSRSRISSVNRRLAGVLIDIFYDHYLAKNWNEYSSISLEEYADNFYRIFKEYPYFLPEKLTKRMPFIIEENWLLSYRELSGIERTVDRISKIVSNTRHPLVNPMDELINNYESFEDDFKCFFPHVIKYANELKIVL